MAQAFNNLGTEVHVLQADDTILSRSDKGLAGTLQDKLKSEGVRIHTGSRVSAVAEAKDAVKIMADTGDNVAVDELLLAVGRSPNTNELNLSAAGVKTEPDSEAIAVGPRGQTNQSHIYAIGDVVSGPRFTHLSEQQAKLTVFRALYKLPLAHDKPLPRVTYADPELAEVGMIGRELDKEGISYDTYTFPYDKLDRAITDDKTTGSIKVWTTKGAGSILGAAVLGDRAGELIGEFALAIEHNLSLRDISQTMHPYPTYGLGVRRLADQYLVQNQPSWLLRAFNSIFGYRGDVFMPDEGDVI
jgi:pyruvate/2-oxoglutarate dehydrogenase complex dihydrolipoamide dehydrogenase (E3) component